MEFWDVLTVKKKKKSQLSEECFAGNLAEQQLTVELIYIVAKSHS